VQAQCPECSARIQVDDAKVPDKPFKVRCPKCQAVISLPGRGADFPTVEAASPEPAAAPPGPASSAPLPSPSAAAVARRERAEASAHDALIALSGPAAKQVQQALVNLGFDVDLADDVEEGARLLEQGVYEVAVTARTPPEAGKPETLAQRMLRLPPDTRRRVFVILVGEEFRTGEGTQAWAAQADLVVHPADAGRCEHVIRSTMTERRRLYQPFLDARQRVEGT
jgi:predicted Zn finger-like uncharacterized protein